MTTAPTIITLMTILTILATILTHLMIILAILMTILSHWNPSEVRSQRRGGNTENLGQTDIGQTSDRQTDEVRYRVAPQLKRRTVA